MLPHSNQKQNKSSMVPQTYCKHHKKLERTSFVALEVCDLMNSSVHTNRLWHKQMHTKRDVQVLWKAGKSALWQGLCGSSLGVEIFIFSIPMLIEYMSFSIDTKIKKF